MRRSGRLLGIVLGVVLALMLSVICVAGQEVELNTIAGPGGLDFLLERCRLFQDDTGVRVNVTVVPYGRDQNIKLMASFMAGGSQYDVFVIDCVEVPRYVEAGWVLPVDEYVTPEMKKDLLPFAADGMVYKGHWYGLPWASEWKSFLYNATKLQQAGYKECPRTWADLAGVSKKLQNARIVKYGTAWSWAAKECLICDFVAVAATFGAQFFDEAHNPLFNSPEAVRALQWMIDSLYEGKISNPSSIMWTENEVEKAMAEGDIAFGLYWTLPLIPLNDPTKSKTVGQWRIGLMPSEDGTKPYTIAGPMGWSISFGTKHKKEAAQFMTFIADREGARIAAVKQGTVPGWASLFKDPDLVAKIPGLDAMLEQGRYIVNRPKVPWYLDFSPMFAAELNAALARQKTAQQALSDAFRKTLEIRKSYEERAAKVRG